MKHSKKVMVESRWWLYGISLYNSFNFDVWLKNFVIKCWGKYLQLNMTPVCILFLFWGKIIFQIKCKILHNELTKQEITANILFCFSRINSKSLLYKKKPTVIWKCNHGIYLYSKKLVGLLIIFFLFPISIFTWPIGLK